MSTVKGFRTLKHYEAEIVAIKRELDGLPAGTLVKRGMYYYVKNGPSENGITKNQQKIRKLARKTYLSQRLRNLEHNYSLACEQLQKLKTEDPEEIIDELSSACQSLSTDYFFDLAVQSQQQRPVSGNASHSDGLIYLTDSGFYVRSKSERTIANMLDQFGIPYRYEAAITLGGKVRYPDFSVFRPFDGKLILWEHFGLVDQEAYRQMAIRKLALYAQNGFLPFDNLICTYEYDILDPSRIEALIEMVLSR
jgi:hypothetical protein